MTIESRLAKQEGINKSRSEKVEKAKAFALESFGTDSPAALKKLYQKIKPLEDELNVINQQANEHLHLCLEKIENNHDLSDTELQQAKIFITEQKRIREEIDRVRSEMFSASTSEQQPMGFQESVSHAADIPQHVGSITDTADMAPHSPSSIDDHQDDKNMDLLSI